MHESSLSLHDGDDGDWGAPAKEDEEVTAATLYNRIEEYSEVSRGGFELSWQSRVGGRARLSDE